MSRVFEEPVFRPVHVHEVPVTLKQSESTVTSQEARQALSELRNMTFRGPWPWIRSLEAEVDDHSIRVFSWLDVPDRDDPNVVKRVMSCTVGSLKGSSARGVVRSCILRLLEHEMDESIYVGKQRVFDPHEVRT